ncbi:uncharacterized protein [Trachinotus anak]|uniref:uncharacterized protein isoform X2 n=1 Tax=Trachinotus anak TaxID=443729 RepID=UPI0039F1DAF5
MISCRWVTSPAALSHLDFSVLTHDDNSSSVLQQEEVELHRNISLLPAQSLRTSRWSRVRVHLMDQRFPFLFRLVGGYFEVSLSEHRVKFRDGAETFVNLNLYVIGQSARCTICSTTDEEESQEQGSTHRRWRG